MDRVFWQSRLRERVRAEAYTIIEPLLWTMNGRHQTDLCEFNRMRSQCEKALRDGGLPEHTVFEFVLGWEEALVDTIQHGERA